MANLKGLASIVSQLRIERTNLVNQFRHVDAALSVLGVSSYTKPRGTLSAAARRRISLAQKARWAKRKTSPAGVWNWWLTQFGYAQGLNPKRLIGTLKTTCRG